jgi:putative polymerase
VLFLGAFELLFVDQYTNVFNIMGYYVSTGNLEAAPEYTNSKLQLNGIRPDGIGRTLLPALLGNHRISSVFLEPVSLGNFATICAAWGLSLDKSERRKTVFFVTMAIGMIILSDSRFALTTVSLMIVMRLITHGKALYLPILAPFIAVILLLYFGVDSGRFTEDSFKGRLALSGQALYEFDLSTLFATSVAKPYADMGYAHLISAFGLPLSLMLWFSIWFLPMPDEQGQRFRAFAAIYIVLILCVSGYSLYALKTSGVLWFLMGCCLKNPAPIPQKPIDTKKEMTLEPILLDVNNRIRRRTDVY